MVNEEEYIRILYYDTHLVVGSTGSNTTVVTVLQRVEPKQNALEKYVCRIQKMAIIQRWQ